MADEDKLNQVRALLSAEASFFDGSIQTGGYAGVGNSSFYVGDGVQNLLEFTGQFPEKLVLPKTYHRILRLCYDFYIRGGVAGTVINRLAELSITEVRNGQRRTSDEANDYYEAMLHRRPARLQRFLRLMGLEYFLSGMVLPVVNWTTIKGSELSPKLKANKEFFVPTFDLYPPNIVRVIWNGWGEKTYLLKIPSSDIKTIKSKGGEIKDQQVKYNLWLTNYPDFVESVSKGNNEFIIQDVDPIMRKETTFSAYPTPFLYNVLESLLFKEQLRKMDYAVASRVINAILLVQEGDKDFPLTEDTRGNLDILKQQIYARTGNPKLLERLFILFSNHTTKLTWISPDVEAMLNQAKYEEANDEIAQGLGFAQILITGESRNSQAAELSTWAIKPQMEELQSMLIEWMESIYEQAGELNGFRNTPEPKFKPIQLQDFVKTAAVFAQAFKEGNVSRTTRDDQIGIDFETEQELMLDEKVLIDELNKDGEFKAMPYNVQVIPGAGSLGGGLGRPPGAANAGGRPLGSQNVPINNRNRGVKPDGQTPASRVQTAELISDEEVITLLDKVATSLGLVLTPEDIKE